MIDRHVLLDSSVLINVLATGREVEVLRIFPAGAGVCATVEGESLFLRGETPADPPVRILLAPLIDSGLLQQHEVSTEAERSLYVDLASELDDGEAMTIAIAHHRRFVVATDDRKARRVAAQRFGNDFELLRTSDLLFSWTQAAELEEAIVHVLLRRIERVAQFRPANDDPLREWWINLAG